MALSWQPIQTFSLERLPGERPRAALVVDGRPTQVAIDGAVLEGQFIRGGWHLLLLTDDCPFEEGLHVHLLDEHLTPCDHLELGLPYAPGHLRGLEVDADRIHFSFFGDERWSLEVRHRPARSWADLLFWQPGRSLRRVFVPGWLRLEMSLSPSA